MTCADEGIRGIVSAMAHDAPPSLTRTETCPTCGHTRVLWDDRAITIDELREIRRRADAMLRALAGLPLSDLQYERDG